MIRGVSRHRLSDRGDDFYATPAVAVETLLRVDTLPHSIREPACGDGAIARVLDRHGHLVFATDLVERGYGLWGVDFLMEMECNQEAIVTNPPFKLSEEFLEKALELCPHVIFLRLAFLESERRSHLLDTGYLHRVHVFRKRLPMMHRHGWTGPEASSATAFAWFVFDTTNRQDTIINRI